MEKIKVLWISDAVVPTGFSRVSHSIIDRLPRDKYDISMLGVNYYGDPHIHNINIYPASTRGDIYGINRISELLAVINPQLIFILNDMWIVQYYLEVLKTAFKGEKKAKIITYFPVDALDHDSGWYEHFDIVNAGVVYTEFGKMVASQALPNFDFKIIPHGNENNIFFRVDGLTKKEIRRKLYPANPELMESFIFFNGNRNQPRKRIDITMNGFRMFSEGKPDNIKLYLHMGITDTHVDIVKLAKRYGIESRMILTNFSSGVQTIPDQRLNLIYNATDVGLNTSLGEGWGLVNTEHAATGAPQIVPAHSACYELFHDCGLTIPVRQSIVLDQANTTAGLVSPEDLAAKMELIYSDKDMYERLSKASMEKFTSSKYSWNTIAKQWDALFDEVLG